MLNNIYGDLPHVAVTIISLSVMLLGGFLMSRLTKLVRLPNVTAYIIAGILIGPFCLNIIPADIITHTEFLPDIALAFIAFSTGEFFKIKTLKKNGLNALILLFLLSFPHLPLPQLRHPL